MDSSDSTLGILLLGLLLFLSALFSAAELALFAVGRPRLRQHADAGDRRAATALRLLENPGRLHASILVADNLANVGAAVVGAVLFIRWFGLERAALYTFLVMGAALLVFGEIVPKIVAVRYAERLALGFARPVAVLARALWPLIRLLTWAGSVIVLPLRGRVTVNSMVTEEEIRMLVQRGEEEGVIEEDEREMIHSIFEFGDTVAREVMIPRMDIEALEDTTTVAQAVAFVLETGHSRVPVFHESIDNVAGVLYHKDLLRPLAEGRHDAPVTEVTRPPYYVPESKRLDELFREMQRRKVHLAIVVDEYGGTSGLVTVEDLLEEIVGPIHDEYDVEEEKLVEVVNDQVVLVDGRVNVEELNEQVGLNLPVGEVDTVGGLVYSLLGHVPQPGERIRHNTLELTVEQVEGQRIAKVRITRPVPTAR